MNWNIKVGKVFSLKQLNENAIRNHTDEEYKPGYSGWLNTYNGLICEHILTDLCGYTNDDTAYKDVLNPDGVSVEVKSYNMYRDAKKYKAEVLATLWERKVRWRKDISNYVVFFERDDDTQEYTCDELFEWDDTALRYISVQSRENVV